MTRTRGAARSIQDRLVRGAQAQVFGHVVRVVVQVGTVSILVAAWGLDLYGEWLVLAAIPTYLAYSDTGLFAAATNEMVMSVGRDDRNDALIIFQTVSRAMGFLLGALALALPAVAASAPLTEWLNLSTIGEATAVLVAVALGLDALLTNYAGLLYAGFACEGRYGEGAFGLAAATLGEFCALAAAVLAGGGPALAATAMLGARVVGTVAMFGAMRRHAPWLRFGRPAGQRQVLRRMLSPALASGAFPMGFALNLQAMVVLIGVVAGPASAAVFSTLRTMSRVVIQLLSSVFSVVAPEISKAYAAGDEDLLRLLHRRACQAAVWLAAPIVIFLAVFGDSVVRIWTSGAVEATGALLYLFLAVAAIDALWFTSLAVPYATNRHQRLAVIYLLGTILALPLAYVLLNAQGLDGAALSLVALEAFMLVAVLRQALPEAHDTLRSWLGALVRPPAFLLFPSRPRAGPSSLEGQP